MEFPKSLFNKVAGLRLGTLFKKETLAQALSCEFCEIFNSTFFIEHLRWLLLKCELQWNLPIADIPNSWHAFNSGNLKIFVELPPNTGHLLITDKFLRPVDVRSSEVSLYFDKKPVKVWKSISLFNRIFIRSKQVIPASLSEFSVIADFLAVTDFLSGLNWPTH